MGRGNDSELLMRPVRRGIKGIPNRILNWSDRYAKGKRDAAREDFVSRSAAYKEMLHGLDVDFSGYVYHKRRKNRGSLGSREKGFLLNPNEIYDLRRETVDGYDVVSWLDQEPRGRAGIAVFQNGKLLAQTYQERDFPTCKCWRTLYYPYECPKCWKPNGGALVFKGVLNGEEKVIVDFTKLPRRSSLAHLFSGLDRRRLKRAAKKYIRLRG